MKEYWNNPWISLDVEGFLWSNQDLVPYGDILKQKQRAKGGVPHWSGCKVHGGDMFQLMFLKYPWLILRRTLLQMLCKSLTHLFNMPSLFGISTIYSINISGWSKLDFLQKRLWCFGSTPVLYKTLFWTSKTTRTPKKHVYYIKGKNDPTL